MDLFSIACSTCRARLKVTDPAAIGHILACPKCGSMVQVVPPPDWQPVGTVAGPPSAANVFESGPPVEDPPSVASETASAGDATATRVALWAGIPAAVLLAVAVVGLALWRSRPTAPLPTQAVAHGEPKAPAQDAPAAAIAPGPVAPVVMSPRWLPDDAQRIVSFRWNETAAQSPIHAILSQMDLAASDPNKLLSAAQLEPAHVHRLTWAGGPEESWLTGGVTVVELATPRPEALPPAVRGTPLDLKLGGAVCHQPATSQWPHPWAQVDERTIVTAPLPILQSLAERSEPHLQHAGIAGMIRAVNIQHAVTLLMPWGAANANDPAVKWLGAWLSDQPDWTFLRDEPLSLAVALDFQPRVQTQFALLCTTQATADQAHVALKAVLDRAEEQLAAQGSRTSTDKTPGLVAFEQQMQAAIKQRTSGVTFPTVWGRIAWDADPAEWANTIAQAATELQSLDKDPLSQTQVATVLKPSSDPQPSPLNPQLERGPEVGGQRSESSNAVAPAVPLAVRPSRTPQRSPIETRLADRIPAIEFNQIPLTDLVELLKDITTVPIGIDLQGLAEVGVSPDEKVTLHLANGNAAQILDDSLTPLKLGFVVENNQVLITNARRQRESLNAVEYSVSDLAADPQALKDLAALFQRLVEPTSWQAGGGKGIVELTVSSLVVNQSRAVHRQLQQLCDKLRLARGLTVKTDASSLTLDTRIIRARQRLQRPITINIAQDTPLEKVLSQLERSANCTILIDSATLSAEGLSAEVSTTLKATRQPFSEVLASLLDPLGLSWRAVDEQTFQVTTPAGAAVPDLEFHRATDLVGPNQTAAQLLERVAQAVPGDANTPRPVVHFDQPSAYLLVLASQRDQIQLESLLNSWRVGEESPK